MRSETCNGSSIEKGANGVNGVNGANGANGANGVKPEPTLLDHDFHSAWGSNYSMRGFVADDRARELWMQFSNDPGKIERQYNFLLSEYTETFRQFFTGYWPISLHSHVSDVLVPTTLATLILNTASTSPLIIDSPELSPMLLDEPEPTRIQNFVRNILGWQDQHVRSPRFAIVEGIYGGSFGPLAHASKEWEYNIIATGQEPFTIRPDDFAPDVLIEKLVLAKQQGCIAVVVDLVSTSDGTVFSPAKFALLKRCCLAARLFLVVDEAMTAIRCGAPWAFQRQEYSADELQPDLVVFGKGLCASGAAINFNGLMMQCLAFQDRHHMIRSIRFWRALVSRPIPTPVLIESLGILNLAHAENWPARSVKIGEAVQKFVRDHVVQRSPEFSDKEIVRGLGAFIAVDRKISAQFLVMAAIRRRSSWVRWLPKLDSAAVDPHQLQRYIIGSNGREHRKLLSNEAEKQNTLPLWCFVCGIDASAPDWCRTCFLGSCGHEDCVESFHAHLCVS